MKKKFLDEKNSIFFAYFYLELFSYHNSLIIIHSYLIGNQLILYIKIFLIHFI